MASGGGSSAVKFVASDADGLPLKRKQAPQACQSCRRKKKRCIHTPGASDNITPSSKAYGAGEGGRPPKSGLSSPPPHNGNRREADADTSDAASQLIELSSRFVGDMNPEGILIGAISPPATSSGKAATNRSKSELGTWFPARAGPRSTALPSPEDRQSPASPARPSQRPPVHQFGFGHTTFRRFQTEKALFERRKHDFVMQECLVLLPPEKEMRALQSIFFSKMYPLFPIISSQDLSSDQTCLIFAALCRQVVALAASTDPTAAKHLRLGSDSPLLSFQEFHQRLADAILMALDLKTNPQPIIHKIELMRLQAVMSLFYQPSTSPERDIPVFLLTHALHHCQTLGLHLSGYVPPPGFSEETADSLFLSLWALDRLTPAIYARAILLPERDFDRDLEAHFERQPPCFRIFLDIMQILDTVFCIYRPYPYTKGTEQVNIPDFEAIAVRAGGEKVASNLLATLEILYHAVVVLSCRQAPDRDSKPSSTTGEDVLPHSTLTSRRTSAANRIMWIVQSQDYCLLPWVPYAVSLALGVQYKTMRYSRLPMYRSRARAVFKDAVAILKVMGRTFPTARVNASLGDSIMREMEKTANSLTVRDGSVVPSDPPGEITGHNATALEHPASPGAVGRLAVQLRRPVNSHDHMGSIAGNNTPPGSSILANLGNSSVTHESGVAVISSPSSLPTKPTTTNATTQAPTSADIGGTMMPPPPLPSSSTPLASPSAAAAAAATTTPTTVEQSSILENFDVDLFGYFDPSFNLGAVDAALEGNLDVGFPQTGWTGAAEMWFPPVADG